MRINLGVLGSIQFTDLFEKIIQKFSNQFMLTAFPYQTPNSISELINQNQKRIDVWLLSDYIGYSIATQSHPTLNVHPVPLNSTNIALQILQYTNQNCKHICKLSIDNILPEEEINISRLLEITFESIHFYKQSGSINDELQKLISFHLSLYKKGIVELCVTGNHLVYQAIMCENVPVILINHDQQGVYHVLKEINFRNEIRQLKSSQIAIQIVQVGNYNKLMNKEDSLFYDIYRLYLRTQELILTYAENIFGSYVSIGSGRFLIFSTKGAVEDKTTFSSLLLKQINSLTSLSANIGMGYGLNAVDAERNARLALNYAEKSSLENCIFLVSEDGVIKGPLQETMSVPFKYGTEDKTLMEKLKNAKVSITTYEKMLAVQKTSAQNIVTSNMVAQIFHMTDRNARKVLSLLESAGLAEIVGNESPASRGRPRKIFRIREC